MLKKIAASGVVAAGAITFLLGAAPAQANTMDGGEGNGRGPGRITVFDRNTQSNEANTGLDACGAEIITVLSNAIQGQRNEQGKCAKASFNVLND